MNDNNEVGYRKRLTLAGAPHHVTQRGSRRGAVFFYDEDRELYLELLKKYTRKFGIYVLDYCLMTNHVHLLLIPPNEDAFARALKPVHKTYADTINKRMGWTGHLWQERFFSSAIDAAYLWIAIRYIERNPVEAGLVTHPAEYKWSSAAAHCGMRNDTVLNYSIQWQKELSREKDWYTWLNEAPDAVLTHKLIQNTGRDLPSGSDCFLDKLEIQTGIPTRLRTSGRPRKMPTR